MKVTVCQLNNETSKFEKDWSDLVIHCNSNKSDLVVLPEMPFYPWIANQTSIDESNKHNAIKAHEKWIKRFDEFEDTIVAYSKPKIKKDKFLNTSIRMVKENRSYKSAHQIFFSRRRRFL